MCRLLGRASLDPITDREAIGTEHCSEFQRLGRLHADGWGTAWLAEDGSMARLRDPGDPVAAASLTDALNGTPCRVRVTHLRLATTGMANVVDNTHPFRWGDIVLAHNGSVTPVGRLRELVTAEEIARIGGTTDSALVFALVVRRVEQGVPLFSAVTDVVEELKNRFPRAALNLLVASGTELIAVHANAGAPIPRDDFAASGLGEDLPRDHVDHYYRMSWLQGRRSVVFSSSGLATEGWTPMAQNSAARVDLRSLAVEFRTIGGRAGTRTGEAA
ncbi:class II glutamine amidotransferase [Microlunatus sp. Gsoil 973]|uniref:class II glutamine amidotransferase n=1 Tax=Microlunatus sp. Gsoil 973 TaxID=2672569 RepID=UPI0012B4B237|nr:class II glutamine amidotransferase [Microlunatus sp. Gsoil 973]QGN32173.1 hypothetical protein GJV80_04490 [Microlunatus sp. Gsoil 973]